MGRHLVGAALGAAALASGCGPSPTPPAQPVPQASSVQSEPRLDLPEEQRSTDLFGAWLVESVAAPDPLRDAAGWDQVLLVGVRQLQILSQCITIGPFAYERTEGGGIAVRLQDVQPLASNVPPAPAPVVCARTLTPAERKLGPLLLAAHNVERQPDGTVLISGPAGSLAVRRPAGPLANPRGEAPAPRLPPLIGAWRFVSIAGRPVVPGQQMELLLRPRAMEWRSGCVSEVRALDYRSERLIPGEQDPFPVCERGRSEAEQAASRLFAGPVTPRMRQDGGLRLEGSGIVAELEPLTA